MPLERAEEVAVDLGAATAAEVPSEVIGRLREIGRELRSGVVILNSSELAPGVAKALDSVGALHPVFGANASGLVVVLPEVRIETEDAEQASKVRDYLRSSDIDLEIIRDAGERLVVRPSSGRGGDALDLANRVEEAVHPAMAQARFLRIVPKR